MGRRESSALCHTCRQRHLKCNLKTPPCDNCAKSGRECQPTSTFIFRPMLEKERLRHRHRRRKNRVSDASTDHEPCSSHHVEAPISQLRASCTPPQNPDAVSPQLWQPVAPVSPDAEPRGLQSRPNSPPPPWSPLGEPGSWSADIHSQDVQSRTPAALTVSSSPITPLRQMVNGQVEESVFGFYINHAGPWLDAGSSRQHFSQTVPRLAVKTPVLYHACLAYASQVLLLHGKLDRYVYEQYSNEAISVLIPLLSPEAIHSGNEVLLLAAVILRMGEQFSELAEDARCHLQGAYSLFTAVQEKWSPSHTDLRGLSFWTYVRESIRVCFLNEEGCQFDMDMVDGDLTRTAAAQDEEAWANHMSYLLARLCNTCWGEREGESIESAIRQIGIDIEEWQATLPDSYQPWCSHQESGQPFRVLRFLSPWHELAWQQFYTAKVMLAVYGSWKPAQSNCLAWSQFLEADILYHARLACSVCTSSSHVGCNTNGAHLVAWCGQFFTGKEEQRILSDFLKGFMEMTGWPNKTCHDRLEQIWEGRRSAWKDYRTD